MMTLRRLPKQASIEAVPPSSPKRDVGHLGQVFTPPCIVNAMLALRQNRGRVLEPSCGNGAFCDRIDDLVAIEIDSVHAPKGSLVMDFFAYPLSERFRSVIGNPPYVRFRDIAVQTKHLLHSDLLDGRANLYLYFIEKAVRHLDVGGELIFITPRDFLKSTGSCRLNRWLFDQGTITHAIELGDARVFADASPNCLIWRYEKGEFSRRTKFFEIGVGDDLEAALNAPAWDERNFVEAAGFLSFTSAEQALTLSDIAVVKVGAVSGDNEVFSSDQHGNRDFVCSHTHESGQTRRMIWTEPGTRAPAILLPHQERLKARGIRAFDDSNWWEWGRGYPLTSAPRIYVNMLTRRPDPFFLHPSPHFDGSVLAIFPRNPKADLPKLRDALNAVDWRQDGFVCDGRFRFSQRSLACARLEAAFLDFSRKLMTCR